MTKYSEAQRRAVAKYRNKTVDRIELNVPAGRKAVYQEAAARAGMSLNQFIIRSIEDAIDKPDR